MRHGSTILRHRRRQLNPHDGTRHPEVDELDLAAHQVVWPILGPRFLTVLVCRVAEPGRLHHVHRRGTELVGTRVPATFEGTSLRQRVLGSDGKTEASLTWFSQVGLNDAAPGRDLLAVGVDGWRYMIDAATGRRSTMPPAIHSSATIVRGSSATWSRGCVESARMTRPRWSYQFLC